MTGPVLELDDVTRIHGSGTTAVHALRGVSLGSRRRARRRHGAERVGQVDAAQRRGRPRHRDLRRRPRRGHRPRHALRAELGRLRRRSAGYVFQDLNLIPTLTAAENVALPLELDGRRRIRRQAIAALDEVGVGDLADRYPDEMSGGQQQRVAIARALVGERRLVLADEPTGALDSETGEAVLRLLRRRVDQGCAGVLVTHESRHAAWADRVVYLRDGSIVDSTSYDVSPGSLENAR